MDNNKENDSYNHILKYTGIFGGVQGLNILMGIVRNKLVAVILGPEGMGLISLFNSTIKLVSDSTNLGISMSAVREISEAWEKKNMEKTHHIVLLIRMWSLLTALAGMLICILLSPLLNKWTFNWGDHTIHFVFLSPVIFLTTITASELAILKGTRQLKNLAVISIYGVFGSLITSIPLYYFWHESAIIPSLIIIAVIQMLFTILFSYRMFPLKLKANSKMMGEGMGMIKLGIAFVLAGILGSGAEFLIRTYLNNAGNLAAVGLYNAGYMMTMTYAGMVFQAMETDYFPRLSGIQKLGQKFNDTVNKQIEVSLLLISPLLVLFITAIPILLPLLYSGKFMPIMGMMKITIIAMYFRAIALPIEYIPLAKGDSRSYLLMEAIYDVLIVIFVIFGYRWLNLAGTGIAITTATFLNVVIVYFYNHYKYGYRLSRNVVLYSLIEIPLGIAAYLSALLTEGIFYWIIGMLMFIVTLCISIQIIHSKTHLWNSLVKKFSKRFIKK